MRHDIINDYFEWLCGLICGYRYANTISYDKLLMRLHSVEFTYLMSMDENRAKDGVELRWRFALDHGMSDVPTCLDGPCSVLEMMIALSVYCEENIMDNPNIGNRTGQWFWSMVVNLGLGSMTDNRYNKRFVDDVINRFLNRDYERNGKGGLFRIDNCDYDVRNLDIQHQLCLYLNNIT